ncbi:MAG TPA: hypothetical protein VF026_22750, partial [Ktedonobacteraceae bacterium]
IFVRVQYDGLALKKGTRVVRLDEKNQLPDAVDAILNRKSIMPLENQTKTEWLVRCKMEHAEKETEAVHSRL